MLGSLHKFHLLDILIYIYNLFIISRKYKINNF
jgi:hypothetical protein